MAPPNRPYFRSRHVEGGASPAAKGRMKAPPPAAPALPAREGTAAKARPVIPEGKGGAPRSQAEPRRLRHTARALRNRGGRPARGGVRARWPHTPGTHKCRGPSRKRRGARTLRRAHARGDRSLDPGSWAAERLARRRCGPRHRRPDDCARVQAYPFAGYVRPEVPGGQGGSRRRRGRAPVEARFGGRTLGWDWNREVGRFSGVQV